MDDIKLHEIKENKRNHKNNEKIEIKYING